MQEWVLLYSAVLESFRLMVLLLLFEAAECLSVAFDPSQPAWRCLCLSYYLPLYIWPSIYVVPTTAPQPAWVLGVQSVTLCGMDHGLDRGIGA